MTVAVQKKICMLGGFSVGKTSLVKRYVASIFSESYLTTVGVKIDKKTVTLGERVVHLILWDLAGEDDMSSLRMSYLRGSAGYVLVADGTRPATLETALSLRRRVEADYGPLPFALLLNKNDRVALRYLLGIGSQNFRANPYAKVCAHCEKTVTRRTKRSKSCRQGR